jgi:hypothetical protein
MKPEHFGQPRNLTPGQPIAQDALKEKYLKAGETGVGVSQAASRA